MFLKKSTRLVSGVLPAKICWTAMKREFEAITFLQISTFGSPLSRSFDLWRNHPHDDITTLVIDWLSSSITQPVSHTEATSKKAIFPLGHGLKLFCFSLREPNDSNSLLHHLRHAKLPVFASFTGCLKLHICRLAAVHLIHIINMYMNTTRIITS